jgi:hypothetical protein
VENSAKGMDGGALKLTLVLLDEVVQSFTWLSQADQRAEQGFFEPGKNGCSTQLVKLAVFLVLCQMINGKHRKRVFHASLAKGVKLGLGEGWLLNLSQTEGQVVGGLIELVGQPYW